MTTRYLYATAPDGTVLRRRTHRAYTHAVIARTVADKWTLVSMHEGHTRASERARAVGWRAQVVEVTETKP
jgi:hypothetical protein